MAEGGKEELWIGVEGQLQEDTVVGYLEDAEELRSRIII
jgi:hypothetical protein